MCCRRAPSHDDSVTLKNCSSESTLNADVTPSAPATCDVITPRAGRRPAGLSSFNPFGCRRYSTGAELRRAVTSTWPLRSADGGASASTTSGRRQQAPDPPRRTTSLSCAAPPTSSVDEASEKTSEIQKLASLAQKLAAIRRASAISSRTLPTPRSIPPILEDWNAPPSCDDSRVSVTSSPSEIATCHSWLGLTSDLSRETVAEKKMTNSASANEHNSYMLQPPPAVRIAAVCNDDAASTLLADRPVSPKHGSSVQDIVSSSPSSGVAAANRATSTAGAVEFGELRDEERDGSSTKNDADDDGDPSVGNRSATVVSATTFVWSSSVKDGVTVAGGGPVPVSARLIITSPVSSRACFVENPHRRSMCKPLTLPRVDEDPDSSSGTFQPRPSSSLRRRCGGLDEVDPSNCGRSWYDVVRDGGDPRTVAAQPLSWTPPAVSFPSSDGRSVSLQSSAVSDNSLETSNTLRRSAHGRRITEPSAADGGRDAQLAVRVNSPTPVLQSTTPRTVCAVNGTRSLGITAAADAVVSKSSSGVGVDGVVRKGASLQRLKKPKHRAIGQPRNDTDSGLSVDVQRLNRPTFGEPAANDWRTCRENETESRSLFTSYSLGRRDCLRTGNKFTGHCSARIESIENDSSSGHVMVSSQLSTGAT